MDYIIGQKPAAPRPAAPRPAAPRPAASPAAAASRSAAPPSAQPVIIDGDQRTFMQDVIEASRSLPVIVDFWATWCGPCKQLTPALERVVTSAGGRLRLVKIDIDKNKALVSQLAQLGLPLQSVPTVAAFWHGQIADIFQGNVPESEIKRFAEALLKLAGGTMPEADLLAEGRAALEAGKPEEAADAFSAILATDPESPEAWGGLVRALLAMGDEDQAQDALAQVPAKLKDHAEIAGARSALALAAEGRRAAAGLAAFTRRLEADPNDHEARYELATALNASGRRAEAADALLDIVRRDRAWREDGARQQLLKFFESWGFDDPASMAARRKLSALLFA
jgi:putative thioredoxin